MGGVSCLGWLWLRSCNLASPPRQRSMGKYSTPSLPTHPPWTLSQGAEAIPLPPWHARVKCRLGFCPALDQSSSTWSKTSGDGNRLFVVELSNLITNLWKRGGSRGRILTPRCTSAGVSTHCLPGPPQGSGPPVHSSLHPKPGHACNCHWTIYRTNIADN